MIYDGTKFEIPFDIFPPLKKSQISIESDLLIYYQGSPRQRTTKCWSSSASDILDWNPFSFELLSDVPKPSGIRGFGSFFKALSGASKLASNKFRILKVSKF